MTSSPSMASDSMSSAVSGSLRRTRAEAARTESVRVRLSRAEAAAVTEAAARAGMSVGAWVGETAVGRARAGGACDRPGEADRSGPSSQRQLVAALVALRAEVAALRVPERASAVSAAGLLDDQRARDIPGGADRDDADRADVDRDDVVGVLRRIDVVTAAAVGAVSSAARHLSRTDAECSVRS